MELCPMTPTDMAVAAERCFRTPVLGLRSALVWARIFQQSCFRSLTDSKLTELCQCSRGDFEQGGVVS